MKIPTRTIIEIDHDKVIGQLQEKEVVVYECSYEQGKSINSNVRTQLGCGLSMKAHMHDLEGNVLSYRFKLVAQVKRRAYKPRPKT